MICIDKNTYLTCGAKRSSLLKAIEVFKVISPNPNRDLILIFSPQEVKKEREHC